jgi:regulator of protease activity HflC (stomatin/prohibitin superfamily)
MMKEELVGPALVRLKQLVEDDSTPAAVQLGAVRDILDRTGYKAPAHTERDVIPPIGVVDAWIDQLEAEEVDLPE